MSCKTSIDPYTKLREISPTNFKRILMITKNDWDHKTGSNKCTTKKSEGLTKMEDKRIEPILNQYKNKWSEMNVKQNFKFVNNFDRSKLQTKYPVWEGHFQKYQEMFHPEQVHKISPNQSQLESVGSYDDCNIQQEFSKLKEIQAKNNELENNNKAMMEELNQLKQEKLKTEKAYSQLSTFLNKSNQIHNELQSKYIELKESHKNAEEMKMRLDKLNGHKINLEKQIEDKINKENKVQQRMSVVVNKFSSAFNPFLREKLDKIPDINKSSGNETENNVDLFDTLESEIDRISQVTIEKGRKFSALQEENKKLKTEIMNKCKDLSKMKEQLQSHIKRSAGLRSHLFELKSLQDTIKKMKDDHSREMNEENSIRLLLLKLLKQVSPSFVSALQGNLVRELEEKKVRALQIEAQIDDIGTMPKNFIKTQSKNPNLEIVKSSSTECLENNFTDPSKLNSEVNEEESSGYEAQNKSNNTHLPAAERKTLSNKFCVHPSHNNLGNNSEALKNKNSNSTSENLELNVKGHLKVKNQSVSTSAQCSRINLNENYNSKILVLNNTKSSSRYDQSTQVELSSNPGETYEDSFSDCSTPTGSDLGAQSNTHKVYNSNLEKGKYETHRVSPMQAFYYCEQCDKTSQGVANNKSTLKHLNCPAEKVCNNEDDMFLKLANYNEVILDTESQSLNNSNFEKCVISEDKKTKHDFKFSSNLLKMQGQLPNRNATKLESDLRHQKSHQFKPKNDCKEHASHSSQASNEKRQSQVNKTKPFIGSQDQLIRECNKLSRSSIRDKY